MQKGLNVMANPSILYSISEANRELEKWTPNITEDQELPQKILNAIEADTEGTICGSADDYHNLASEYARKGFYAMAATIAVAGASRYTYNIDLLADIIKYSCDSQRWNNCKKAYERLCTMNKKLWNWRAFTFSINYLIDRCSTEELLVREVTYNEALALSKEYKESSLQDERAWVAEAELFLMENEVEKAIQTLVDGVAQVGVAPQCCVKLSDIYLKRGEYENVIKYSAIGARATAQEQPSASIAYLYYVSALAKDALIHQAAREQDNGTVDGFCNHDAVNDALIDYEIAEKIFLIKHQSSYLQTIRARRIILQKKSGIVAEGNIEEESTPKSRTDNDLLRQLHLLSQIIDSNNDMA
ncbi:hypothetical protein [Bacteroides acidifaciens]|uniref:tetratricopeptide repeat protein n=1 Tax=Bacteroides acidifaciens TaxID=85831 RepID=UPI003014BA76